MPSVSFGKRERVRFNSDGALSQWKPMEGPAVYAVTYKQDAETRPKAHTVIYFGETDNLVAEAPGIHQHFAKWLNDFAHGVELFVFTHPMPGSTKFERTRVANTLVSEYDPRANN